MADRSWKELHPAGKAVIVVLTVLDLALRFWALRDLARRDPGQVNGPRWLWGIALGVVTSSGILPAAYFVRGRKRGPALPSTTA